MPASVMNCARMSPDLTSDITDDKALGGRLRLLQPRKGHRFGHDAILLAAAVPAQTGEHAVDLGAGVGCAGLALAARVPGVRVTLVEIDPALAALAAKNAERNAVADRVAVATLDVAAAEAAFGQAGLAPGSADHVLMNPPFHDVQRAQPSPDAAKRSAHLAGRDSFSAWAKTAARLLRPDGVLTVIYRADGLDEVLAALAGDFGAAHVLPVCPKPGAPPIRVIVRAVRGETREAVTVAEIYLNDAGGRPSAGAEAVLRDAAALTLD